MDLSAKIELPELPELTFEEATHTYRLNGIIVPSVTQLTKLLPNDDYAGIPNSILENAAKRGTEVHESIETFIKYGIDDCRSEYLPYYNAFKRFWKSQNGAVAIANELPVYYDDTDVPQLRELYGTAYAGTLDMLAVLDGKLTLLDFKCTTKVYENKYALQLEAYSRALAKYGIAVERKIVLQLKKDETYKIYEFPINDERRWAVFRSLRIINNYR